MPAIGIWIRRRLPAPVRLAALWILSLSLIPIAAGAVPTAPSIDAGAWVPLTPAPRGGQSTIYDPVGKRMVIFGGQVCDEDGDCVETNDVWELTLGDDPLWRRIEPAGAPPAVRFGHVAVYDPSGNRMIVWGGENNLTDPPTGFNDTWELTLGVSPTWTELLPDGVLPGGGTITFASAIYDPGRDRMVLYGGGLGDEIWLLTLGAAPGWTSLIPPGAPIDRIAASAIYDPVRDRMVVFGGFECEIACGTDRELNDVWELTLSDPPTWSEIFPAGLPPSTRWGHVAIYDPVGDRMIVDGGSNLDGDECANPGVISCDDSWALSLGGPVGWTEIAPAGEVPARRVGHSAVHDPDNDRLVIWGEIADAWALLLADPPEVWTQDLTPGARVDAAAVYDGARGRMLEIGGLGGGGSALNDVWSTHLVGSARADKVLPSGSPPAGRSEHSAVHDPSRDAVLVYGGRDGQTRFGDAWSLLLSGTGGPAWLPITPMGTPPSARSGHAAVWDPPRDRMVVFGGAGGMAPLNDTWALLPTGPSGWAWMPLSPVGTPPVARMFHAAVYVPTADAMIVFGGVGPSGHLGDLWALFLGGGPTPTWVPITATGVPPSPRRSVEAVYDGARDRVVFFGGQFDTTYFNEAWELSLPGSPAAQWTLLNPTGDPPSPRSGHVAIYDAQRDRMVAHGGRNGAGPIAGLWGLHWSTTTAVGESESPPAARVPSFAPNPGRDAVKLAIELSAPTTIRVRLFDVAGRMVREIPAAAFPAGKHVVGWDGRDRAGSPVPSGVYYGEVTVGSRTYARRVVILR